MLISYPHLMLTVPCGQVTDFGTDLANMVDQLHKTRRDCSIVGADAMALAGPQIGYPMRMFVWTDEHGDHTFINPVIIESEGSQYADEGCLSMLGAFDSLKNEWRKGLSVQVTRANRVLVRGQDVDGTGLELEAEGFIARVMQHEIDHLDGILITNRCTKQMRKRAVRELEVARRPYRKREDAAQAAVAAERLRQSARARARLAGARPHG